ncbi:MAG: D-tyrosyl-tRNA(Tyr) deacylase [Acidimicrobiia bacterium]|nr:D-tyrosyl-tRNA(Tyr) deacylase [Acidimicrobiia bacterium]
MRAVAQRVSEASVTVGGNVIASVGAGMVVLIGIAPDDTERDAELLATKLSTLRIFADDDDQMNLDVASIGGSVLAISQFTLMADVRKGRRPSFVGAAAPEIAEPLFGHLVGALRDRGLAVETGRFGARMAVSLTNDGPVTIVLEARDGRIH